MSAISSKEQKQLSVSIAALEVIEAEGLGGVTHSKVARKAGVSRAWIYEYIGNEKSALIEYAADVLASHFARVKLTEIPKTKADLQRLAEEGTDFLFTSVDLNPVIIQLYFRYRGTRNPIGEVILKHEKQWLSKSTKTLVDILGLTKEQAELLTEFILTMRMGYAHRVATSKNTDDVHVRAKQTFQFLFSLVSGLTG
ncbi:MAG: TetR family transcriptional regulator [Deltaproteobacteria bacterium]|nr:TetR family transcriptional regulator [Deltaproteobacteria bacterium]